MLYEVCLETRNGSVRSVAVESQSRKEARLMAREFGFASKKGYDPVIYVRRISEDTYLDLQDGWLYDEIA